MSNSFQKPPFPFEHRRSDEDIIAYNNAIDNDSVRELFRKWAEEDDLEEEHLRQKQQDASEKEVISNTMRQLVENSEAMRSASALNTKTWMTKSEAAKYLGVSERTIDRKREAGALKASLIEGTTTFRFNKNDLDELLS